MTDRIASEVERRLSEGDTVDLIAMGRGEGPGCYCYVNNLLREALDRIEGGYRAVVVDNEAGMEHLSRRNVRQIDHLVLVGDPSPRGLAAVAAITADFDEQGRLYVADSSGSNEKVEEQLKKKPHRILRLEDSTGAGRFDRQVVVPLPDIRGREQILLVHMRKVPMAGDVKAAVLELAAWLYWRAKGGASSMSVNLTGEEIDLSLLPMAYQNMVRNWKLRTAVASV